jgi:alpha-1,6-mannosyltransferase
VKLCDVTQFYSPFSGGVKRYLHEKIAYIQDAMPYEHVLIIPGAKSECIEAERSRIYTIRSPLVSRTSRYRLLLDLRALEEIVERERPDLIESSDPYQIGWRAIRVGERLRVPVIGFYHSHFAEAHVRSATRFFGEGVMKLARGYVCRLYNSYAATLVPSAGLAAELRSWGLRNTRTVSLGLNTSIFTPMPDDRLETRASLSVEDSRTLLLYVGRLSPEKNTLGLFRAFQIVAGRAPEKFHLLVIGDGRERKQLRELQTRHDQISWLRYCDEPAELARYYRAADLFVHPGTQETFGLVALESQACGTPVVGVRGTYMDEVIRHDQTWWATEPEALAVAIEDATRCDLAEMGSRASAQIAEEFSWPCIFQRLFYIYEEVCSKYGKQNGPEGSATAVQHSPLPPL